MARDEGLALDRQRSAEVLLGPRRVPEAGLPLADVHEDIGDLGVVLAAERLDADLPGALQGGQGFPGLALGEQQASLVPERARHLRMLGTEDPLGLPNRPLEERTRLFAIAHQQMQMAELAPPVGEGRMLQAIHLLVHSHGQLDALASALEVLLR